MARTSLTSIRAPAAALAGILAAAAWLAPPAGADIAPLTLYQKTARAPLVVKARALSGSTRRPQLEVIRIYKGSCPSRIITIAPHFEDYSSPTPWLRREVFRKDEESILFLTPQTDESGKETEAAIFTVLNADQGKLPVPAEGAAALEDALGKIVAILLLGQHDLQGQALRALLREGNPYLVEAGLEECRKFRLAVRDDLETLLRLLSNARPDFRAGALALIAQVVEESRREAPSGSAVASGPAEAALLDSIAAAVRLDPEEAVRRQAVSALGALGGPSALALLDDIGRSDPSQNVRYEAQVAAHRLRQPNR